MSSYSSLLDIREMFNIAAGISAPVVGALLLRYIVMEAYSAHCSFVCPDVSWFRCIWSWHSHIYERIDWTVKASIGWFFVCFAETIRSIFIWDLIHFYGTEATYAMQVVPLTLALAILTIGMMCIIRQFTPSAWNQHSLWVPTLAAIITFTVVNFIVYDRHDINRPPVANRSSE
jgi:hypothetical protein